MGAQAHSVDPGGKQNVGPNLFGVCGRQAGTSPGYAYSNAMKNKGIIWSESTLDKFLQNPRKFVPGTKMVFAGIKKKRDRHDVIAYLCSLK